MKLIRSVKGKVVVCSLVFLALTTAYVIAQAMQQGEARVTSIKGTAHYSVGGGAMLPLKAGTTLRTGAVIQTGADSWVHLRLGKNNGLVRVNANSVLALDKLTYSEAGGERIHATELDVKSGSIWSKVDKMNAASHYEVKTPVGVAGIRGTLVRIMANGNIVVCDGTVYFVYIDAQGNAQSVVIPKGMMFDGTGLLPAPPGVCDEAVFEEARLFEDVPPAFRPPEIEVRISPTRPPENTGSGGVGDSAPVKK